MSREFEDLVNTDITPKKSEGVPPNVFDYMRTIVGDQELSEAQARQLRDAIEISYDVHSEGTETGEFEINLSDEVQQQMRLLRAIRKDLFFASGAPRPETEGTDIKGYLNSSIQLMNLLQKVGESLKTDKDVRAIESAIEQGFEALTEHPDSTVAKDFVEVVTKALEGTELGDKLLLPNNATVEPENDNED